MSEHIKETRGFQTEVKQLLHLMVHALYSNKEIFLRELISNASDAANKLSFNALSDDSLYEGDPELKIWLSYDKDSRTITIRDNGIGMSFDDVVNNLGTIAKSGTQEFLNSLTGDKARDSALIGQFGVGFYSAFIVADSVDVLTRKAGLPASSGVRWSSDGQGEYSIESIDKSARGTEVVLHLKEGEDEFLNEWRLKHIITKYSNHITVPVIMEVAANEAEQTEEQDKKDSIKPVEERVNEATALWTVPKADIDDEHYKEFYKKLTGDYAEPLSWSHNKVEGKLEYTSLLYLPSSAGFELYSPEQKKGLKLYVKRVFILDNAEQFLPNYLRFVKGLIDTNDLPLNVSREILQKSKVVESIKTAVVKRSLAMLSSLAKDDKEKYAKFWQEFGVVLKEGPAEDLTNKEEIAKLLRFSSTFTNNKEQNVALEDYVARMKADQEKIYYISADSFNAASNSPHLEIFRKQGIEVLLLSDRIDEWLMAHLANFAGKTLQSVTKGKLDGKEFVVEGQDNNKPEVNESKEKPTDDILLRVKESLGDKIKEVRISDRLTSSASCIVVEEHAMTVQMEKILKAAGQLTMGNQPILEINPQHALVKKLIVEKDADRFNTISNLLLEQAILLEGGQLEEPAAFIKRINELLFESAD